MKNPTRSNLAEGKEGNKDGEYQDDEIRSVGDKLKETEDKIKEGTLQVDQGTDAMTLVLGKEKGGYARGVGSGVTYKRYFDLPQSKQAADERILLLESQLDAARREREEKELLIKSMSSKMSQTEGMVTKLKNQLAAQGGHTDPIHSRKGGTTGVGYNRNDASIRKERKKGKKLLNLWSKKRTRSSAMISVKIPNPKKNVSDYYQQLLDAVEWFLCIAKESSCLDPKATPPSTIQMITGENKTAPKVQTKRKNVYVSSDAMKKEANKKRSQKALIVCD
ncbi:hypothetical protein Tco_1303603 [Tanacetum coccineum]